MKKWIIYGCLFCLLAGCSDDKRLKQALQFAGENRGELEKVLDFYKYDHEKYAAARFLIENMPRYYAYRGEAIDSVKRTLIKYQKEQVAYPEEVNLWKGFNYEEMEKVYDSKVITAEYLINNIERAFRAWKKRPWNKNVSFDEFCELILPYRILNEPLEDWRKSYEDKYAYLLDSLYTGSDVIAATDTIAHALRKEGFVYCWDFRFPHLGASFLMENRVGMCVDACDFSLYVYRALGIPIAIDMYVYSSETRKGHTWNVVKDTTGRYVGFWFSEQDALRDSAYSDLRKAGKTFRQLYGNRIKELKDIWEDKQVPSFFKDLYRKDSSVDYYPDTLTLITPENDYGKYAFLGVFNPHYWVGIDMAEVKDGKARFPHVESKVVYTPMSYDGERYIVTGYPFYFDGKSNTPYTPDLSRRDTVRLLRKNPLFAWQRDWLNSMAGCMIEFSDTKDFGQVKFRYRIADTLRLAYNTVHLPASIKCRYVRFKATEAINEGRLEVAECTCFAGGKPIRPTAIDGSTPDNITRTWQNACDDDPLSIYSSAGGTGDASLSGYSSAGGTLVLDYGQSLRIDSLAFMPHNDDNFIRIGDEYELFYHGGKSGWVSLGRRTAVEPWLIYDNMPQGALFHLRCLTRGEEEQVFHIENGVQVFISNQAKPVTM